MTKAERVAFLADVHVGVPASRYLGPELGQWYVDN